MIPILRGMTKGQVRRGRRNVYLMPVALMALLFLIGQAFWLSKNTHMFAPFSIARIQCDTCSRIGMIRDEDDSRILKMCPACFGIGYHQVRYMDNQDVLCTACGGMGRIQDHGVWRTCQRCDGRGLYRAEAWLQKIEVDRATPPATAETAHVVGELPKDGNSEVIPGP